MKNKDIIAKIAKVRTPNGFQLLHVPTRIGVNVNCKAIAGSFKRHVKSYRDILVAKVDRYMKLQEALGEQHVEMQASGKIKTQAASNV